MNYKSFSINQLSMYFYFRDPTQYINSYVIKSLFIYKLYPPGIPTMFIIISR